MSRLILTLSEASANAALTSGIFDEVFLWTGTGRSTFTGSTGPFLHELGAVNPINVDLVRIALGVLATDRSILRARGGSDWNARDLDLTVDVASPDTWSAHADELSALIGFLTGDHWTFSFTQAPAAAFPPLVVEGQHHGRTVLLSGGADSAVGALLSALDLGSDSSQALVSHFSFTALSPVQRDLVSAIEGLIREQAQVHHQFHLNRGSRRLDGTQFRSETSTRSRSFLFLALGLAVAERAGSTLWIPENGFASLNPPLGPDRRGSLSTHTTHPRFLSDLSALVTTVGGHGALENPFETITKGEMFRRVAAAIGFDAASRYLSATNSCSHTDGRYSGAPSGAACGVCFGCLVRRSAFNASDIPDTTTYLVNDTTGRFIEFVRSKNIVEPMRDFVHRGVRPKDVMAMSLPDGYRAVDAVTLCALGVEELRGVVG
ncbi:hypothetical protein ASE16_12110 [Leifsonia sp. Root227]|uniref:hypothetical protein n=1 Tax=Leifsonia sp. Root227 TaxID=1736496 RepID=UPI0006F3E61B|nr:hypothetical protein [Leifsonia sp. Root227]KRC49476.1 hypothetical protein ASE16_12110 [Leifsonia sp. Root227]